MRRGGAFFIATSLLLAGCGGGGAGSSHTPAPGAPPATTAKGSGTAQFSIKIPAAATALAKSRTPKYLSPATKSFSVNVAGTTTNVDVVSGSPGCATDYTQPSFVETAVNVQPRGMVQGPDGNIWFVEDAGLSIGSIAPGGVYTDHYFGYFENGIIVGPDGALWTTSPYNALLGHITFPGAVAAVGRFSGYPHDIQYIAKAGDNTVWGTAYTELPSNVVYHIALDGTFLGSDTITTQGTTTMPALGPDGAMYVTETDGTNGWVARIAKSGITWSLTNEFPVTGVPYAITAGPDNALWIVEGTGHVYRMTTGGAITNTYQITPGAGVAIHVLADGALWIAEYDANKIARLTTGGTLNEFPLPSPSTHPYDVASGSDGVYFSEQLVNKIGRVNFPIACTATASLPAGSATATVTAYDGTSGAAGGGNVLSTQTLPVTIALNATTVVNFVLNGVVKSLTVSSGTIPSNCASSGSAPLIVEAQDASGNAIIGPGNYSDASGNALTFTLATSDTSGHSTIANSAVTGPSAMPALNWSGGTLITQTITATVSGGTVAGSITPATIFGNCT